MEQQISGQFDPVTQIKILKGAVIALSGAIAILVLLLGWGLGIDKASLAAFFAWLVPTALNAGHQFFKGDDLGSIDGGSQ